jgi:hypothetical protein
MRWLGMSGWCWSFFLLRVWFFVREGDISAVMTALLAVLSSLGFRAGCERQVLKRKVC